MNKLPTEILEKILKTGNIFEIKGLCSTNKKFYEFCNKNRKYIVDNKRYNISLEDFDLKKIKNVNYALDYIQFKSHNNANKNKFIIDLSNSYIESIPDKITSFIKYIELLINKYKFIDFSKLKASKFITSRDLLKIEKFIKQNLTNQRQYNIDYDTDDNKWYIYSTQIDYKSNYTDFKSIESLYNYDRYGNATKHRSSTNSSNSSNSSNRSNSTNSSNSTNRSNSSN